jgi:hypothetical protein
MEYSAGGNRFVSDYKPTPKIIKAMLTKADEKLLSTGNAHPGLFPYFWRSYE